MIIGSRHSEKTKKKIRVGNKDKKRKQKTKDRISLARKGISFSKKAHNKFHKKYGGKNNTLEQILEFIEQKKLVV